MASCSVSTLTARGNSPCPSLDHLPIHPDRALYCPVASVRPLLCSQLVQRDDMGLRLCTRALTELVVLVMTRASARGTENEADVEARIAQLTTPPANGAPSPIIPTPVVGPSAGAAPSPPPQQQSIPSLIHTPLSNVVRQLCASLTCPKQI